ncbi:hypothetical protein [Terrisporobacter sp.]|uniref:hypothetical protein n=1 Tax=Terrisporobacter sp. TaxID=1965305 RepID=UPI00289AA0EB|nr:hypothetical protein [Terrisporobacter sp.]
MKKIEKLDSEIKIGKILKEDDSFFILEVDKDGNELEKFAIDELCEPYINKEYVQFCIKYSKEI